MANMLAYIVIASLFVLGESGIGLYYGTNGSNLTHPSVTIPFLISKGISDINIFGPDPTILKAVRGTGMKVAVGTGGDNVVMKVGTDYAAAQGWVQDNIVPYAGNIRYILAGNEMIPGNQSNMVYPAMVNLNKALKAAGLNIPVSTVLKNSAVVNGYPPSNAEFDGSIRSIMESITSFLVQNNSPLFMNIYPYFALRENPEIRLEYALFTSNRIEFWDGNLRYWNLFDALLDGAYAALEKVRVLSPDSNGGHINVKTGEHGWPTRSVRKRPGYSKNATDDDDITNIDNARIYNNNFIRHVSYNGTPRRPNYLIEAYTFAIFNENRKDPGIEQNFGLFYPDLTPVYPVDFHPANRLITPKP